MSIGKREYYITEDSMYSAQIKRVAFTLYD